jgi:asparagine synthase (glutamine-hydrolysing)
VCGIAGFVSPAPAPGERRDILEAMCASMHHRGPDSGGAYVDGQIAIGMRRLSINDLQGGDQPLFNENRSMALVCNGEIYNSPELRATLREKGHRFATRSDCEVIVHGYEQWGSAVVDRLNGMFAFALWDGAERRLVLARDRAGIKPLFYAHLPGGVAFGSEIKALLRHPDVSREIDPAAIADYLTYEYVPTPSSIFKDVRKLPPGHMLTLEAGSHMPRLRQYWDLDLADEPARKSVNGRAAADALLPVLEGAVRRELLSDVPVGVLLSGGVDSSVVAALAMRATGAPVDSFSIAFDDPSFDESHFAQTVAARLGTRHHELTLGPDDVLGLIPRVAEVLDEPMADSSLLPTFYLSQFARSRVKVALGGDGGDELFGGYPTLQAHRVSSYFQHVPSFIKSALAWGSRRLPVSQANLSLDFKLKRFAAGLSMAPLRRHESYLGGMDRSSAHELLAPDVRRQLAEDEAGRPCAYDRLDCLSADPINQVLHADFKLYLENDILVKVDRASMANSLEVRVPLLNSEVIDFAAALPPSLKLHGLTTKYLLKEVARQFLPAQVVDRPKKGFNMPVARWFSGPLKSALLDALNPSTLKADGLFDPEAVGRLVDEHFARRADHRKPLWALFVFQNWYERYARPSAPDHPPASRLVTA